MSGAPSARERIRQAFDDYPELSHRQIARMTGLSPSTIDRSCRAWRMMTRQECPHGRGDARQAGEPDASRGASPDRDATASQGASRAAGSDAPWHTWAVALRPRQPEPDAPADARVATEVAERWRCGQCHWLQAIGTVDRCEFCGWSRAREITP